jgi:hypothetical protein
MNPTAGGEYNYEAAGFDGFLSRSIDNLTQVTLSSPGPVSTAIPFDRGQQSGSFGDSIQIGSILLDGAKGRITITDDAGNTVVVLGELDD